jgi:Putative intracellular protease/amidase
MANTVKDTIKSRKIAALISDGFDASQLSAMKRSLTAEGSVVETVATRLGDINSSDGKVVKADHSFLTAASVLFDAVYVPGGAESVETLAADADACHFVDQAFKHCKAICFTGDTAAFVDQTSVGKTDTDKAVIIGKKSSDAAASFVKAIAEHRNWEREVPRKVPA